MILVWTPEWLEGKFYSFHDFQGHTGLPTLSEAHSGEKDNVTYPTTVPNCLREADRWGGKQQPQSLLHLCAF